MDHTPLTKPKLTPKMREVLETLAKPDQCATYSPYRLGTPSHWSVNQKWCTKQIEGLLDRGLLTKAKGKFRSASAAITPAGREALKQTEVQHED